MDKYLVSRQRLAQVVVTAEDMGEAISLAITIDKFEDHHEEFDADLAEEDEWEFEVFEKGAMER